MNYLIMPIIAPTLLTRCVLYGALRKMFSLANTRKVMYPYDSSLTPTEFVSTITFTKRHFVFFLSLCLFFSILFLNVMKYYQHFDLPSVCNFL